MKKAVLILFVIFFTIAGCRKETSGSGNNGSPANENSSPANETKIYYICTGNSATKYHRKSDCIGLNNCSKDIIPTTDVSGREKCNICF